MSLKGLGARLERPSHQAKRRKPPDVEKPGWLVCVQYMSFIAVFRR